jgi:fatty-acyl-CoA synthase
VVLIGAFSPATYLALLHRYGVTVAFGVPTQFAMLGDSADWGRPLPMLRWFFSGGAPCPAGIASMVRAAGYGFRERYGLTECGPNCFTTTHEAAQAKVGSTGWPLPYLAMRLRADDGAIVGADTVGELELRGPQLFGGYFRAPEYTEAALTADGWLRTGDLATRDADGAYWIRGRRSDMFISGGENVFPGEVEAALLDCPGVREAVVVGVPDTRWGEVGCALIVRHDPTLSAFSLLAAARTRLAGYKVPQRIVFVDALPRLGSGKVDRQGARALVA